jgi:hypothetical protein
MKRKVPRSRPMVGRAPKPACVVGNGDGSSPPIVHQVGARTRELAQRRSGSVEVLLLWHPESDRVELSVRDVATGAGFRLEVAPGNAMDAFRHPYAYAASASSCREVRAEMTIADG